MSPEKGQFKQLSKSGKGSSRPWGMNLIGWGQDGLRTGSYWGSVQAMVGGEKLSCNRNINWEIHEDQNRPLLPCISEISTSPCLNLYLFSSLRVSFPQLFPCQCMPTSPFSCCINTSFWPLSFEPPRASCVPYKLRDRCSWNHSYCCDLRLPSL